MWEGVGDRTELQHIDPHSYGHNCVSFPFFWAAQPGAWGPASLGVGFLYCILSPIHLISKLTDFLSSPGLYNNLTSTLLPASVSISHSFNPSTVKVIIPWYSSTGCTCYLHRCISYFDSPAGSGVNIQHTLVILISILTKACPQGVNVLDSDIIVSDFELPSCYHIHFRPNNLGKRYEPLYLSSFV